VSLIGNTYCIRFAHRALDRRTVVEIQRKFVEKKGQNLLSRLVRAKHDKETIAAWNLDLIRILQIFNVRSAGSVRLSLTGSSQVELALGAYTVTSDMHQNMLKGHEDTSERQILGVSYPYAPCITE